MRRVVGLIKAFLTLGNSPLEGRRAHVSKDRGSDILQITGLDSALKREGAKLSPRVDLQQ